MKLLLPLALLAGGGALAGGYAWYRHDRDPAIDRVVTIPVTVRIAAGGVHRLLAESARTGVAQEKGLMFRTGLGPDAAMLFWPYPPDGGPPRPASFWMKNTPTPLDILFLRADGSIARLAENAIPFSEAPIPSGEPVAAVLEIRGGRAGELGIAEGDRVDWPGRSR